MINSGLEEGKVRTKNAVCVYVWVCVCVCVFVCVCAYYY